MGKQVGVMLFLSLQLNLVLLKCLITLTGQALYGVSILTGVGFTMSLFVGNLAFAENIQYIDGVKIGVLAGSLLSTLFGYFILLYASKK